VEAVDSKSFDEIFDRIVAEENIQCEPGSAQFLRKLCLHLGPKELRACYPADIIDIIVSISEYKGRKVVVNQDTLKRAVKLYFTKAMTDAPKQP
jgi:hypothetical protein